MDETVTLYQYLKCVIRQLNQYVAEPANDLMEEQTPEDWHEVIFDSKLRDLGYDYKLGDNTAPLRDLYINNI